MTPNTRAALALGLLSFAVAASAPAQQMATGPVCSSAKTAIRNTLRAVHDKQRNVGLSAAVLDHGRLVFSEGMGFADLEHTVRVTPRTRFTVASIGKAFTGTTLAILVDSGVIDLDAPIQRYVPEYHPPHSETITLRMLTAHLGGVRHYRADEKTAEFLARHFDNVKDVVALVANDTLIDRPGRAYHYSSYGYNLLGRQFSRRRTSRSPTSSTSWFFDRWRSNPRASTT